VEKAELDAAAKEKILFRNAERLLRTNWDG